MKFSIPEDLESRVLQAVETAKGSGKISKGTNETTKAIERGVAQLVIIAADVQPEEITMHLPVLCNEKKIPHVYVKSKLALGKAAGIEVPTASIGILNPGSGRDALQDVVKKIEEAKKKSS